MDQHPGLVIALLLRCLFRLPFVLLPVLAHLNLFYFPTSAFKRLGLSTKCFCVVFCVICVNTDNSGRIMTLVNVKTTAVKLCGCRDGYN